MLWGNKEFSRQTVGLSGRVESNAEENPCAKDEGSGNYML